jgi:hypothetical protein
MAGENQEHLLTIHQLEAGVSLGTGHSHVIQILCLKEGVRTAR